MKWFALLIWFAAAPAALAQDLLRYEGADRVEKALSAARKEGSLTLYTSFAEKDLPRRFEDLLDARWKGKLGVEARVPDWYSAVVTDMGEEKGIRFFRELVAKNGISVRGGHTLLNNLVIAGDVPLALTMYQYIVEGSKRKGASVDWFVLEPAVARMSGVGIARHTSHPNAALLFYEFMLSTEAQQLLLEMDYVPTLSKLPSPLANRRFQLVDPAIALDHRDRL